MGIDSISFVGYQCKDEMTFGDIADAAADTAGSIFDTANNFIKSAINAGTEWSNDGYNPYKDPDNDNYDSALGQYLRSGDDAVENSEDDE